MQPTPIARSALGSRRKLAERAMFGRNLGCALALAAILLLSIPSWAQTIEVGTGVFCDTQKQMERFVAVLDRNMQTALNTVNAEENDPTACIFGTIAFIRSVETTTARSKSGTYHIVKVVVVGLLTQSGFRPAGPAASFSLERVDERIA